MKKLWLSLSLLMAAPYAKADVASDFWSSGSGIWLFYVQNDTIYRGDCDENRLIYNRTTCATIVDSAPFGAFADALRGQFTRTMPELEQQVADLHARIDEIDAELLMLLNTVPDPVDPTLKDQITAKQEEVGAAGAELVLIEDQISRIEDALRTRENPDLRAQLIELQGELADKKTTLDGLRAALSEIRQRFILANSGAFEPRRFQALQNERDLRVRQLGSRGSDLETIMTNLIAVSQVLTDVLQSGFTNNYLAGSGGHGEIQLAINNFRPAFSATEPAGRIYRGVRDAANRAMLFDIPKPSYVEHFFCKINATCSIWEPALEVTGPNFSVRVSNTNDFEVLDDGASDPRLDPLKTMDLGGQWKVQIANCREQIGSADCFIKIKPRR